jgi:hypothetical protein
MNKERPIIFSAPMVKAILSGAKTQTRRLIKPQPVGGVNFAQDSATAYFDGIYKACPYGKVGDRLWVREKFSFDRDYDDEPISAFDRENSIWWSTGDCEKYLSSKQGKWRPSIHMPRWASRLTLEITEIRVERLQEISVEDAKAEGFEDSEPVTKLDIEHTCEEFGEQSVECKLARTFGVGHFTAKVPFIDAWVKMHGIESWSSNPWVWCVSFRRVV